MREQGWYSKPAQAPATRQRAQNVVRPQSPRKKAPPSHATKTPAPVKGAKGHMNKGAAPATSKQESRTRGKVRGP